MRQLRKMILIALSAGTLLLASAGSAVAALTAEQLVSAGFLCQVAGPHDWVHCFNGQLIGRGRAPIPVMVFSGDGSLFLGTEHLIHENVYAGQPCPQDGLDQWEYVGVIPYYACHHFATDE